MNVRCSHTQSHRMPLLHQQSLRMRRQPGSRRLWLLVPVALAVLSGCTQPVTTPATASTTTVEAPKSPRAAREIVGAAWMDIDFQRELKPGVECQDVGILVTTRGYAPGEEVSLVIGEENGSKEYDTRLYGKVDEDGKARIRWLAMGCVDHMPTPLLQSMKSQPEPEVAEEAGATLPQASTTKGRGKPTSRTRPETKASNPQALPETRPAAPLKQ